MIVTDGSYSKLVKASGMDKDDDELKNIIVSLY